MKVVETRTEVHNGTEYDVKVTCCMAAKAKIRDLLEMEKGFKQIVDLVRPEQGFKLIFPEILILNYCPICGDKYPEEKKRK